MQTIFDAHEAAILRRFFESHSGSLSGDPDRQLPQTEWLCRPDGDNASVTLQAEVAKLVLTLVRRKLPRTGLVTRDGEVRWSRELEGNPPAHRVSVLPSLLFEMVWAYSGPGVEWPEAYWLTWVPVFERWVVTASAESTDAWGHTDLAIGAFDPSIDPEEGAGRVIRHWWQRQFEGWDQSPWVEFREAGRIDEATAIAWREKVWNPPDDEEDDPTAEESPVATMPKENSHAR
jgi:hypothetical protein